MMKKTVSLAVLFISVFLLSSGILAQDDVIQAEYGEIYTVTLSERGQQVFLQFTGEAGDLVYLTGKIQGPGSTSLALELRDSVGRALGIIEDSSQVPFVLAELPDSGMYTGVVTYDSSSEENFAIQIGKTVYLSADPVSAIVSPEGTAAIFGLKVNETAAYRVLLSRLDAELLPVEFDVKDYTDSYGRRIVDFYGDMVKSSRLVLHLQAGNTYILILSSGVYSLSSYPEGMDLSSEFSLSLLPEE